MEFLAGMLVVMALAILVALAFTKNRYAGVGCVLAICIMVCGFASAVVKFLFH